MDLVLFGIQGSGKGTLAKRIAEKHGFIVFEMGGELRKLSQQNSPLGQKVKSIIEAGHLVPDEVVMDIIENFMKDLPSGKNIIFDGIPRKMGQAIAFENLMQRLNRSYIGILVDVPKEVAIKRLSTRRICVGCKTVFPGSYSKENCEKCGGKLTVRSDDNPASIRTRIDGYFNETISVIERYKKSHKMITINGDQSMDAVAGEAIKKLKTLL